MTASHRKVPARAWVTIVVAILAMSSGAIFVRYAEAPALAKAAWRMSLAAALVWPLALYPDGSELRRMTRWQWTQAALSGSFLALHFTTWMASLDYTTVASSVLLSNTAPVWVALLAPWITGDRLQGRGWLGIGLSFGGAAAVGLGEFAISARAFAGDLLALAGGCCGALYFMMGRRLRQEINLVTYLAATYGIAAAVLWAFVGFSGTPAVGFTIGTWGAFFAMALICQHLGHSGYNYALRYISPGVLTALQLVEPVICSMAAWLCFAEIPPAQLWPAAALLLYGIWLVARDQQKPVLEPGG